MPFRIWSATSAGVSRDVHKGYFIFTVVITVIVVICHLSLMGVAINNTYPSQDFGTVGLSNIGLCLILSCVVSLLYAVMSILWMVDKHGLTCPFHSIWTFLGIATIAAAGLSFYYMDANCKSTFYDIAVARWQFDPRVVDFMRHKRCIGIGELGDDCTEHCCDGLLKEAIDGKVAYVQRLVIADMVLVGLHLVIGPIAYFVGMCCKCCRH